jgi:hypothetical protein
MRTAFRKRECARVSKVGEKGEGGWNKWPGQNITQINLGLEDILKKIRMQMFTK